MADNVAFQSTTLATPANTAVVEARDQGTNVFRQVITTSTVKRVSANFSRPADTNVYAIGDLVANSTTAASVVALSWTVAIAATTQLLATFLIRRARLKKSNNGIANASFRLHLYGTDPAAASGILGGDNAAWSVNDATWLGHFDFGSMIQHRDCAQAYASPASGAEIAHALSSGQAIRGLLEARGVYTPASAEVFTVELEVFQL